MPNIKSQEKRARQNIKRRAKNNILKSRIKTDETRLAESVKKKNKKDAESNLNILFKNLGDAAKKGAVHKNFSSNKKSRAAKLVNSIKKSK
ncbi:MAG: 30S ribosomal protein S20 [Actinomycetota bacterium]|nr:30S ribosomal protein S20 [Actinomycetota bacterium]